MKYLCLLSLEVNDFHGEKHTTEVKYVSGKTENYVTMSFLFNLVSSNSVDKGVKYSCLGHDKEGNLIFNESNECGMLEGEQNFSYNNMSSGIKYIGKVKKMELLLCMI